MRNNLTRRLAVWLIAVFICAGSAVAADAVRLSNDIGMIDAVKSAGTQSDSKRQDESQGCERFPAEQVFDNFQQALKNPEKVRCLNPNVDAEMAKMRRLPPGLGSLVNFEVLSLACLESLEALPEEIGNLKKLRELVIDNGNGCAMNVAIPSSIGKLENLRVLVLYGALDPRDIGDEQASRRRKFKPLPETLGNLRRLEVLDLGRNGLSVVPAQLASLTGLKTLRLAYNGLRTLPAFVGNFKNLKELSVDANRKIALPVSLSKIPNLTISMGNNSLKLAEQKSLRNRFPRAVFSFENEYDDDSANEEPSQPKPKPQRKG